MNSFRLIAIALLLGGSLGCSQSKIETPAVADMKAQSGSANADLSHLFSRAWRISPSPYGSAAGSIYVFLPNGTLLETSCVETYRIATWTSDAANPMKLEIQEDNRPAFAATFSLADGNTVHMTQALMLGQREIKEITLTGIEKEFVCPDLKK